MSTIKYTLERGIPFPQRSRVNSVFHAEVIDTLSKLEVDGSALFQFEDHKAYLFDTKARLTAKVYGIVTDKEFTFKLYIDDNTVRVWRLR